MTTRVRHRSVTARRALSVAEEIELVLGVAPDRASLFASPGERAAARAKLAAVQESRDAFERFLATRPVRDERSRRHRLHWYPGLDDPEYPAVFDWSACPLCPRLPGDAT
jgi:hypothetical protein